MKVVIIGGGTAGTTAAFELRKLNKDIEITILESSPYTQYSYCALPYAIEGEINYDDISYYDEEFFKLNKIELKLNHQVKKIDFKDKEVDGIKYDKLIIATGSRAIKLGDGYTLKSIDDAKEIQKIKEKDIKISGGGYVGVELAWALKKIGKNVTIFEKSNSLMNLDKDMSEIVENYMKNNGIKINLNSEEESDIYAIGVKANCEIAKELKTNNGIEVNEYMQTSDKDVYAAGDCTNNVKLALPAIRQAKVAAHNILGKKEMYLGSMGNVVSKVGDLIIGSVGKKEGKWGKYRGKTKAHYHPDAKDLIVKIYAKEGIITGAQVIGYEDVIGRLNLLALAIDKKLKLNDIINMHTCYNPAVSPVNDPLVMAAEICQKK